MDLCQKRDCAFKEILKYACLNKTVMPFKVIISELIRPQKETGGRHVLDFHSNYDESCSLSGQPQFMLLINENKPLTTCNIFNK